MPIPPTRTRNRTEGHTISVGAQDVKAGGCPKVSDEETLHSPEETRYVSPLQLLQLHKFAQLVPPFWVLSLSSTTLTADWSSVGMHRLRDLHVDKRA